MPALLAVLALAVGATGAVAATPAEVIGALNAERAAAGLPAGIVENASWSHGCALHNAYLTTNRATGHDEDPALPGYTPEGAEAGGSSVIGFTRPGAPLGLGPFRTAPIHLMQLLGPGLSVTGVDYSAPDATGLMRVCTWTWPGYQRASAPADALYSFPGDGQSVDALEVARENPFVPGDLVGLPEGTATGPHLYLLADGPWAARSSGAFTVVSATLTGPSGPVEVRAVTSSTPQLRGFLPPGAILIPAAPLTAGGYAASVTLEGPDGDRMTRQWSFTARAVRNSLNLIDGFDPQRNTRVFSVASASAEPTLTLAGPGGATLRPALRNASGLWTSDELSLAPGSWQACARSGGPPGPYEVASQCITVTVAPVGGDGAVPSGPGAGDGGAPTPTGEGGGGGTAPGPPEAAGGAATAPGRAVQGPGVGTAPVRPRFVAVRLANVRRGGWPYARITGLIVGAGRGRPVLVQRRSGRGYRALCRGRTRLGGRFALTCKLRRSRTARTERLRVQVRDSGGGLRVSRVVSLRVPARR